LDAFPAEALPNAVPRRLREFAAGRSAARAAFLQLGYPAVAVPAGPDRAPIWPVGLIGSITHSDSLCLAAVTRQPCLIGVDLEPMTPLDADLWDVVLLPEEQAALHGVADANLLAKCLFSAKEAAYKAQYGRSKTVFGFELMQVTLSENGFSARLMQAVPGFDAGFVFHGRMQVSQGHILTAVCM
jgi:4'-phosphopantetheinyl transferase EntD